jgi:hypothetical protein
VYDVR